MGLVAEFSSPLINHVTHLPRNTLFAVAGGVLVVLIIVVNVLSQVLFRNPQEPPLVFHWLPVIGSSVTYGIDPYKFFERCRAKYGDVFTFVLLGKKTTVYLGVKGNNLVLNGKLKDVNAEEVYSPITTPLFGKDVIYDCPNSKFLEQKKFVKFGLTADAFRSYVTLITAEVEDFVKKSPYFKQDKATLNTGSAMAELTIFTASRSLQGKEVREKFDSSFAALYHDLDMGLKPINLVFPRAPLPSNRKRNAAHKKMADTYISIIRQRRAAGTMKPTEEEDMIWNLMGSRYKDGAPIPDHEIAHMMIALLMAGQHSSSSTISWIVLRLASRPDITEELLQEQKQMLGAHLPPLNYEDLSKLRLHSQVIRETLRLHSPIHSILRKVTTPLSIEGTPYTIPKGHVVLSSPGVSARDPDYFPAPLTWDPHRWDTELMLEEDEGQIDHGREPISKGASSPYLPFGAGRHRCIGEQFAYVQLQTILAMLVRHFKFSNLDGSREVVATDFSSMFTRPINPAVVWYEKREKET